MEPEAPGSKREDNPERGSRSPRLDLHRCCAGLGGADTAWEGLTLPINGNSLLFSMAHNALANVIRHAGADRVAIVRTAQGTNTRSPCPTTVRSRRGTTISGATFSRRKSSLPMTTGLSTGRTYRTTLSTKSPMIAPAWLAPTLTYGNRRAIGYMRAPPGRRAFIGIGCRVWLIFRRFISGPPHQNSWLRVSADP